MRSLHRNRRPSAAALLVGLIIAGGLGAASAAEVTLPAQAVKEFEYFYNLDIPTAEITESWDCSERPVRLRKSTTVGGLPLTLVELFMDRAAMDFDTAIIPDNAVIQSVKLRYFLRQPFTYVNNPISFKRMPGPIGGFSGFQCFAGYIQIGNGLEYAASGVSFAGYSTIDLGPEAVADLQARLADDWFTVGLKMKFDLLGDLDDAAELSAVHDPEPHQLVVRYVLKGVGGPVDKAAVEDRSWTSIKALYSR